MDDRSIVAALTELLRDELREARFHVSHLTRSEAELIQGPHGGRTSTRFEPTLVESWDADGLKALHDGGGWKRTLFPSEILVKMLPRGSESAASCVRFERILDDLGVVSEGRVVLALAPLLPGTHFPVIRSILQRWYSGLRKQRSYGATYLWTRVSAVCVVRRRSWFVGPATAVLPLRLVSSSVDFTRPNPFLFPMGSAS